MKKIAIHSSEKQVQASILDWLRKNKIFHWRNNNTGTPRMDKRTGKIKFCKTPGGIKGAPDIIAVHNGKAIAIEAKSSIGTLSESQKEFGHRFIAAGGIYIMARSIEDVEPFFRKPPRITFKPSGF